MTNEFISAIITSPSFDGRSDYVSNVIRNYERITPSNYSCFLISFQHMDLGPSCELRMFSSSDGDVLYGQSKFIFRQEAFRERRHLHVCDL